jgi:hypothetical protein
MTKFQITNKSQFSNPKHFKLFGAWCLSRGAGSRFAGVLGICLVFGAWFLVIPAKAQTLSLSLWPPILEVIIMPGKAITQAYTITNSGEETIINTKILPFEPNGEHGNIILQPGQGLSLSGPQFSFDNANLSLGKPFRLKSGEVAQVILKIRIPENCPEDDYYDTLLFETQPGAKIGQSVSRQAGTIGGNLLLTVSKDGQPLRKGEMVEFSLRKCLSLPIFNFCLIDSLDPTEFRLRIKNTGRAFWKPAGKILINSFLGQKGEIQILPENILSQASRQINGQCQSEEKIYPCPLNWQPKFLFGPYRARAELAISGLEEKKISAQINFLALPFKLLLAVIIAIFGLILIKNRLKIRT